MPRSTVTSKGQITLPKAVRDALNVAAGDEVAFLIRDDGSVTVEAAMIDLRTLHGSVKSPVRGVSVDQMKETIRNAASRK